MHKLRLKKKHVNCTKVNQKPTLQILQKDFKLIPADKKKVKFWNNWILILYILMLVIDFTKLFYIEFLNNFLQRFFAMLFLYIIVVIDPTVSNPKRMSKSGSAKTTANKKTCAQ